MKLSELISNIICIIKSFFFDVTIVDQNKYSFFVKFNDPDFVEWGNLCNCTSKLEEEFGDYAEFEIGYHFPDYCYFSDAAGYKVYIKHTFTEEMKNYIDKRREKFNYLVDRYSKIKSDYAFDIAFTDMMYACFLQFSADEANSKYKEYVVENGIKVKDADLHFAAIIYSALKSDRKFDLVVKLQNDNNELYKLILKELSCKPEARAAVKYIKYLFK